MSSPRFVRVVGAMAGPTAPNVSSTWTVLCLNNNKVTKPFILLGPQTLLLNDENCNKSVSVKV